MITRTAFAAAVASLLFASPAFAEDAGATDASSGATPTADAGSTDQDAGSTADTTTGAADAGTGVTPTADAGSTDDAGTTADTTTGADAGSTDAIMSVDTTAGDATSADGGGTGGQFTENKCWDEKCPKEVAACKANADCAFIAKCIKDTGDSAAKCAQDAKWDQNKFNAAFQIYNAISTCGWTACADPTAGTCKDRCGTFDNKAPCNCDGLCHQYKDCCADHKAMCAAMYSCKGFCGSNISNQNSDKLACNCGDSCPGGENCCDDHALQCKGTACQPDCTGKECGDDGCGGKCGDCTGGAVCNSGKCIGGGSSSGGDDAGSSSGGDDAGSSSGGSSSGGVTDASDAGSSSGGTTTTPPRTDDGGCTAGHTGNHGQLALVLIALGGLAILRRRRWA